jgi:hypothetical protein
MDYKKLSSFHISILMGWDGLIENGWQHFIK